MLLLVRHGESEGNAAGVLLGATDSPLTDRGRAQVAVLADALGASTFKRVITSPLSRAWETASALAGDVPVEVDRRWIEVDYGKFEGEPLGSMPAEVWRRWRADSSYKPPGGESLDEVGTRVRAACNELFATPDEGARDPSGHVLVVSHVSPIKAAVAWTIGGVDAMAWRLHLSTASVTRIGWGLGTPVLHGYNQVVDPPADLG